MKLNLLEDPAAPHSCRPPETSGGLLSYVYHRRLSSSRRSATQRTYFPVSPASTDEPSLLDHASSPPDEPLSPVPDSAPSHHRARITLLPVSAPSHDEPLDPDQPVISELAAPAPPREPLDLELYSYRDNGIDLRDRTMFNFPFFRDNIFKPLASTRTMTKKLAEKTLCEYMNRYYAFLSKSPNMSNTVFILVKTTNKMGRVVVDTTPANVVKASLSGLNVYYLNQEGERVQMPIYNLWFNSAFKRQYQETTFDPRPRARLDTRFLNTWAGFKRDPAYCAKAWQDPVYQEHVRYWLDHVKRIFCDGNEVDYKWFVSWMAFKVRNPHEKSGTMPVSLGPQGAGKSAAYEPYYNIWNGNCFRTARELDVTGQYNKISCGPNILLLWWDEMENLSRKTLGVLKSLITDPEAVTGAKYVNFDLHFSHMDFMGTSNNLSLKGTSDSANYDRRFHHMRCSDYYVNNPEGDKHFDHIFSLCKEDKFVGAVQHYLNYEHDLSGYVRGRKPSTSVIGQKLKMSEFNDVQKWWAECLVNRCHVPYRKLNDMDAFKNISHVITRLGRVCNTDGSMDDTWVGEVPEKLLYENYTDWRESKSWLPDKKDASEELFDGVDSKPYTFKAFMEELRAMTKFQEWKDVVDVKTGLIKKGRIMHRIRNLDKKFTSGRQYLRYVVIPPWPTCKDLFERLYGLVLPVRELSDDPIIPSIDGMPYPMFNLSTRVSRNLSSWNKQEVSTLLPDASFEEPEPPHSPLDLDRDLDKDPLPSEVNNINIHRFTRDLMGVNLAEIDFTHLLNTETDAPLKLLSETAHKVAQFEKESDGVLVVDDLRKTVEATVAKDASKRKAPPAAVSSKRRRRVNIRIDA